MAGIPADLVACVYMGVPYRCAGMVKLNTSTIPAAACRGDSPLTFSEAPWHSG